MKESETVGESCAESSEESVWQHYEQMVPNNVAFVKEAKAAGRPIVGIYCEFTPRELILAAGGVPVCLCGTSEKTIPAAEVDLPTNLCPLIKSSYGFVVEGTCPYYEMADAVIAETTCDGKKKMFELIAQRRPTHILELTQKVDEAAAYDHWYREVVGMKEFLERTLSVAVTDEALRAAIGEMNEWRRLLNGLYDYTRCHPPVIRGTQIVRTREHALGNPKAYRMLHRLAEALEAKKDRGEYVAGPDAPRIMVTGCPTGVDAGNGRDLTGDVAGDSPRAPTGAPSPILEGVTADLLPRLVADDHLRGGAALAVAGEGVGLAVGPVTLVSKLMVCPGLYGPDGFATRATVKGGPNWNRFSWPALTSKRG